MSDLTEKQLATLKALAIQAGGQGIIACATFSALHSKGMIEKTGASSGARGKIHVKLTHTGAAAAG